MSVETIDRVGLLGRRVSAARAGALLGKDRAFVLALWEAGELQAVDERRPGAKIARLTFAVEDLAAWRESRVAVPPGVVATAPRPPTARQLGLTPETAGVCQRMREKRAARRARRAAAHARG